MTTDLDKIEAYLANLDPEKKAALEHVRDLIKKTAPDLAEGLVYGVPGFKSNGKGFVCYAAFKAHCGFYPMSPELMDAMQSELEGFRVAKGTIHFTPDHPLPDTLIEKIVLARIVENAAKKSQKSK